MNEYKLAQDSLQLVKKDLLLEGDVDLCHTGDPFERLHRFLTSQLQYLLDHDFNRLLNAMYRVDVPEKKLKEILELTEPSKIAHNLAGIVIEREKQKLYTRKKYSF